MIVLDIGNLLVTGLVALILFLLGVAFSKLN